MSASTYTCQRTHCRHTHVTLQGNYHVAQHLLWIVLLLVLPGKHWRVCRHSSTVPKTKAMPGVKVSQSAVTSVVQEHQAGFTGHCGLPLQLSLH